MEKKTMKIHAPKPGTLTMIANVDGDIFTKDIAVERNLDQVKPCSGCEENCKCIAEPMDLKNNPYAEELPAKPALKNPLTHEIMENICSDTDIIFFMQDDSVYNNIAANGLFKAKTEDFKPNEVVYPYARVMVNPYVEECYESESKLRTAMIAETDGGFCMTIDEHGYKEVMTDMAIIGSANRPLGFFIPFTASPSTLMMASNMFGSMAVNSYNNYMNYFNFRKF